MAVRFDVPHEYIGDASSSLDLDNEGKGLAHSLHALFAPRTGQGLRLPNRANPRSGIETVNATPTFVESPYGPAINYVATSSESLESFAIVMPEPAITFMTPGMTVMCMFRQQSGTSNFTFILGSRWGGEFYGMISVSNQMRIAWSDDTTYNTTGPTITNNVWYLGIVRARPVANLLDYWLLNLATEARAEILDTSQTIQDEFTATAKWEIAADNDNTGLGRFFNGDVGISAFWNRALADLEVHSLLKDPYLLVRPEVRRRPIGKNAAGAPAGTTPSRLTLLGVS